MSTVQRTLQEIRKEDNEHTQKLLFIVKLREVLRMRLSSEDEKLANSNAKVASKISSIMHGQTIEATALLQKGRKRSERTAEEIAADALKHIQALGELVNEVQSREDGEMLALLSAAKKRRDLGNQIEAQQEALT